MRFHTLQAWLDWQSTLHPAEIELGLERVSQVWRRLCPAGLPSRVISIAGTNGKGSTAAMLESIYRQAGYRVGLYTSPHLVRYTERIRVNGVEVAEELLCETFERVDRARDAVSLTYFEFGTLAALDIFARAALDLCILEVGLGGRLDAVNIIDPDVSIITTVDLDHTAWLGDTRDQIGLEKAGIMRTGRPVILGQANMPETVLRRAAELGAECWLPGRDFSVEPRGEGFVWRAGQTVHEFTAKPALPGSFQLDNVAAVLMAVESLAASLPVEPVAMQLGVQKCRLRGRLQVLEGEIPIILDVAHNPQAVTALKHHLVESFPGVRLHAVFGLLSDKDVHSIMDCIAPMIESWHLVGTGSGRGQSAEQLRRLMQAYGIGGNINCHASVLEALGGARAMAGPGDAILVFGSFVIVGEALDISDKPVGQAAMI